LTKLKIISLFIFLSGIANFTFGKASLPYTEYDSIAKRLVKLKSAVPIEYNQYVQTYITEYIKNENGSTSLLLGKGLHLQPEIEKILKKHHLPIELKFVAIALSSLNYSLVSSEGSSGIWQLKYHVAKTYGLKINSYIDERRDPLKSSEAASQYFEDLYKIYEDWPLAIAAFYSSPLDVNKAIRQSGGNLEYWKIHSYLPENIQIIVPRFVASMYIFNFFRDHKLTVQTYKPLQTDTVAIRNWTTFQQIEKVLFISQENLKEYNPIFKKGIIPYTANKYFINIPSVTRKVFKELEDSLYIFKDKEPGLVTLPDNRPKVPNPADTAASADEVEGDKSTADEEDETRVEPPKPKPSAEVIKGKALLTYTVKKGDGLGKIADKYDCTITDIKKWNKLKSNMIKPGQKLKIYVPKAQLSKYNKKK